MRVVSPLLKHFVYPALATTGYLRRHARDGVAVVTYHGLLPPDYRVIDAALDGSLISANAFQRQLRLLKRNYNVISPEQFRNWCNSDTDLPSRSVLLTCDDGLRNTLEMLPILRDEGMSCLFFVTGGCLADSSAPLWYEELYLMFLDTGESFTLEVPELGGYMHAAGQNAKRVLWLDLLKKLSRYDAITRQQFLIEIKHQLRLSGDWLRNRLCDSNLARRILMLDVAGLRQLVAAGMTIGAHTMSHPMLPEAPHDLAWQEMSSSRSELERALGQRIWAFAYPFGGADSATLRETQMAERAGFDCAFVNTAGGLGQKLPRFAIPRTHVSRNMNLPEFEAHVSGLYEYLRRTAYRTRSETYFTPQQAGVTQ